MAEPLEAHDSLAARLDSLEQRVAALENGGGAKAASAERQAPQRAPLSPRALPRPESAPAAGAIVIFSTFGKAMLGVAGAYVLRAVAESSVLPRAVVAYAAIMYAILWLAGAGLARSGLARAIYACTSALILAPMLWELTMSFRVLSPVAAAIALAAFFSVAFGFAWKRDVPSVVWTASVTASALALGLAMAAHSLAPFLALLLFMLLLGELGEMRNAGSGVRMLIAAAADIAIWIEIYIYASPLNAQAEYPSLGAAALIAPALVLFAISGGSAMVRTVVHRKTIGAFDTLQATIAFLLAACALLLFTPSAGGVALRIACFVLAATLYAISYRLFDGAAQARNYAVFTNWSAALLLTAVWMSMPQAWLTGSLCVMALAATALGSRFERLALEFHGGLYLLAASLAAGLPGFIAHALVGAAPVAPGPRAGLAAASAVICYVLVRPRSGEAFKPQMLHLVMALLAAASAAAMIVTGAVHLVALGTLPGAHHLAFLRTLVLCMLAIAMAFAGARTARIELTRIGYAALAAVGIKLLVEDLQHGHFEYIAASIFLFALTLIAAPRVARAARRA